MDPNDKHKNQRKFIAARKAEGLERIVLWVNPEDKPALREIARQPQAIVKRQAEIEAEIGPVRSKATFSARFSHSVENKQLFSFFVTCNTEQKSGFYKRLKPKEEFYVPYILSFGTISAEIDLI